MLSLEETQGNLTEGFKYLMGGNEEESSRHFSVVPTVRTKGDGYRLEHSKFMWTQENIYLLPNTGMD